MKSNQVRVRIGVRLPIFVNAATGVVYTSDLGAQRLIADVEALRATLVLLGAKGFADRLICSVST